VEWSEAASMADRLLSSDSSGTTSRNLDVSAKKYTYHEVGVIFGSLVALDVYRR
jgi:hypothetical protein